jgi:hypothetical protein
VWDRVFDPVAARSAAVVCWQSRKASGKRRGPAGRGRVKDPAPHEQNHTNNLMAIPLKGKLF